MIPQVYSSNIRKIIIQCEHYYSASSKVCVTNLKFPPPFQPLHFTMLRVPLVSISNNHVRKTELTPYQRGFIVGAHSAGINSFRIHKLTNLSNSIIHLILKNAAERDDGESKPRSDRPFLYLYETNVILFELLESTRVSVIKN